jgi:hypothetical protein
LGKRPPKWLHQAAAAMVNATKADFVEWQGTAGRTKRAGV